VDRVKKAAYRMGAQPLQSDDIDIVAMNSKQLVAMNQMKFIIEPIRNEIEQLGLEWEYMTWKVGINIPLGRLHININKNDLRLMLITEKNVEQLNNSTGMVWRASAEKNRKSINIKKSDLLGVLNNFSCVNNLFY
jgi:hypothetical protein